MREIKFRAWNAKDHWYFSENICPNLKSNGELDCEIGFYDEFVIEQYTGLKDKNGKEIYEGDILCYEYNYEQAITHGETQTFGEVKWNETDACWYVYGAPMFELSRADSFLLEEDEICGNIHENSDLLKNT